MLEGSVYSKLDAGLWIIPQFDLNISKINVKPSELALDLIQALAIHKFSLAEKIFIPIKEVFKTMAVFIISPLACGVGVIVNTAQLIFFGIHALQAKYQDRKNELQKNTEKVQKIFWHIVEDLTFGAIFGSALFFTSDALLFLRLGALFAAIITKEIYITQEQKEDRFFRSLGLSCVNSEVKSHLLSFYQESLEFFKDFTFNNKASIEESESLKRFAKVLQTFKTEHYEFVKFKGKNLSLDVDRSQVAKLIKAFDEIQWNTLNRDVRRELLGWKFAVMGVYLNQDCALRQDDRQIFYNSKYAFVDRFANI